MKVYENLSQELLPGEVFKPVKQFPRGRGKAYRIMDFSRVVEVSNLGRVRRADGWEIYKQREQSGCLVVDLYNGDDAAKNTSVSRLVAFTFLPTKHVDWPKARVSHKDGNPYNNSAKNLTFVQPSKKRAANDMLKKGKTYAEVTEKTGLKISSARQYGYLQKKKKK